MPDRRTIEILFRTIFDRVGLNQADRALQQMGVRWNEVAQRYQSMQTGQFLRSSDVQRWQAPQQAAQPAPAPAVTTAPTIGAAAGALVAPSADMTEVVRSTAQFAKDMGVSFTDAARSMSGLAISGQQSEEAIIGAARSAGYLDKNLQPTPKYMRELGKEAKGAEKSFESMQRIWMMGIGGFTLAITGRRIMQMGLAVLGMGSSYVEFVGRGEETSRRWLDAQYELEESQRRIGRELADVMVPAMEQIAEAATIVAQMIEAHPEIAKAAVWGGVGAVALGSLLMVAGQIMAGIASFVTVASALGITGAGIGAGALAIGGGLATAGMVGVAAGSGALLGAGMYEAGAGLVEGATGADVTGVGEFATVAGAKFVEIFGGLIGASEEEIAYKSQLAAIGIGKLTGELDEAAVAAARAGLAESKLAMERQQAEDAMIPGSVLQSFYQYTQQVNEAEESYEQRRAEIIAAAGERRVELERTYEQRRNEIVAEYGAQRLAIEAQYDRRRSEIIQNYNQQIADLDADYAEQETEAYKSYMEERTKIMQDYQQQMADLERDHQERLQDIMEKYEEDKEDAIAKRDAYALATARRNRDRAIREENEDYAKRMADLKRELNERLTELQQSYQKESQVRQEAYQEQLAELEAQKQEELAKLQEQKQLELEQLQAQFEQKMAQLQAQHAQEQAELDKSLAEQLQKLEEGYQQQLESLKKSMYNMLLWQDFYQKQMGESWGVFLSNLDAQLREFIANAPDPSLSAGSMATGGYVGEGLWRLHRGEYVLNAQTVSGAERILGSRLSGSAILGAMGGGSVINFSQQLAVYGELPDLQVKKFRRIAREEAYIGVKEALRI